MIDDFLQRLCWVTSKPDPTPKKVKSLKRWIDSKGFPAKDDTQYLDATSDHLMLFGYIKDSGMAKLVPFAERIVAGIERCRQKVAYFLFSLFFSLQAPTQYGLGKALSKNDYLHQILAPKSPTTIDLSRPTIRAVARVIAASLTIFVLLVPILILNFVATTAIKFVVIFIAATAFVSGVTAASLASMAEIFVAGATYAAVLVVFVSQNGVGDGDGDGVSNGGNGTTAS